MTRSRVALILALLLIIVTGCATWFYRDDIAMRYSLLRIDRAFDSRDPSLLLGYADVDLLATSLANALPSVAPAPGERFPQVMSELPRDSFRAQFRGPILAYIESGGVTPNPFVRDALDVLTGRGAESRIVSTEELSETTRIVRIEHTFRKTKSVSNVDIVFEKRDGRWMATEIRNLGEIVRQLTAIHFDEVRKKNEETKRILAAAVRIDDASFVSDISGERIRVALTSICDRPVARVVVHAQLRGGIEGRGDLPASFELAPGQTGVVEAGLGQLERMQRSGFEPVSVDAYVSVVRFSDGETIALLEEP